MGRRSDHTPAQLRALLLGEGHRLMAEVGYAGFSGRLVARRAGYTVGTIYNVFGSLDGLVAAINTRTFALWAEWLRDALERGGEDRIASLVRGYFDFALAHPQLWSAIYEHRLPDGASLAEEDLAHRAELTGIVEDEVALVLPADTELDVARFARSLIASVHGHCSYVVSGSFALLDEPDPLGSALARVRESLAYHGTLRQIS
ncbi:TetR/AcrR family transcriptional regulator [Parerythrobacter lacustris]|uniref:TetR/AcrR family transcriptional regulator n=1 Tax=Parerythrobacter lacustris TaxID=2969984 RepID=A0ABT1XN58_9SPHN|nr:TetR/AcrR family transcriptional regulator [Parerythrobacter lacustris]MCR2833083.1 TetR/AcrR family transcriptional regulator [Parerythrobacter lacustris]